MDIIARNTTVIFKVRKDDKPKVGKIMDMCWMNNGIRYKIYVKEYGKFLRPSSMFHIGNVKNLYKFDTRWVFKMWLNPNKILRIL